MEENPENFPEEEIKIPERPLECSECKKNIEVRYTEIEQGNVHETSMCNDCPELQKKLRGVSHSHTQNGDSKKTGVACGNCETTLESILMGHPLGCSNCYEVFGDTIIYELYSMGKVSEKIDFESKIKPIHAGRSPGQTTEVNPSLRLIALNEALDETLKKEDYEQAALLRDQINELTEKVELEEGEDHDEKK
ncbi:MAG: UvrB/UvrC motif-containing protein [Chlamydiota bacterium]|nr:UvrB/UvrC motif-containing protein [Chlamydiota bacterium]